MRSRRWGSWLPGPSAESILIYSYAAAGRKREARAIMEKLKTATKGRSVQPFSLAATYAALGEIDRAFEVLQRGYEERAYMLRLGVDPRMDTLRSDLRFEALLRRVGVRSERH